jgi:spoIIIJ-associated protein
MQQVEKSAPSVEEALESALAELGISEQEALIEVVQEPRSGFLGIAGQEAIVRVRPRSPSTAPVAPASPEASDEQAEMVADFVEGLLEAAGLDGDVDISEADGTTYVDVWSDDDPEGMGVLIGKRGNTLDAIQELVRTHVHRRTGERCLVVVDVEDYRKRRRSQLLRRASEVAGRVKKTGRQEALEPMNAYERKLVHDAVAELGGVVTASEGEEPNRRVVVRRQA